MPPKTEKITLKDDDGSKSTFKIKKGVLSAYPYERLIKKSL